MNRRLTRGRIAAAGVAVVTVAAVVVLTGVVARGWWRGDGGAYAPRTPLVRTEITPARSFFGQVLTAHAEVVVDPRRVDPASVALDVNFRPFRIRSESRQASTGLGRATVVDFRYEIQCFARACVPLGAAGRTRASATAYQLTGARVTLRDRAGRTITKRLTWPVFGVQSRLTADEIALSAPGIDRPVQPPPVSWAISPDLLGGLALAAAALLTLGAGWLVASAVSGDARPLRVLRIPAHLTPVERALALAEHAAAHGEVGESRKALERLAVELRRRGTGSHAGDAEQLAWSAQGPSQETVAALADAVRSNGAR